MIEDDYIMFFFLHDVKGSMTDTKIIPSSD